MPDNFPAFGQHVHTRYATLAAGELFVVDIGDIFASYLAAFPEGSNPIFRERTEHDCSCCKNFVRNLGAVVAIAADGTLQTVWDGWDALPWPYGTVAAHMDALVRQAPIKGVYRSKERQYGTESNFDTATDRKWHHFHGAVGALHYTASPDEARGKVATALQTLRRGLDEIRPDDLVAVLDLIDQNQLYRGEEKRALVAEFQTAQRAYREAPNKDIWLWAMAATRDGQRLGGFRNDVIGTLLVALAEGTPLERAVGSYEAMVAPTNYRRPTAIITAKQVEQAVDTLKAEGLESAIERRFARLSDVSVANVLFVDNEARGEMRDGIAGVLADAVKPATVDVKHAKPIAAADFFGMVVPQAQRIDVLVDNSHLGNFVSLTAPVHADAGNLFSWGNPFAWSYDGEVADSIKQRVKAAGGNIDAALRVSLAWSNYDDLDIHAHFGGQHIYYGNKAGVLDVDMNAHTGKSRSPVENLAWTQLRNGSYRIEVNQFCSREGKDVGFTLELESAGRVEQYTYAPAMRHGETIKCLTLTIADGKVANVKVDNPQLLGGSASTTKWGVATQTLVPVATLMLSPNHWDGQKSGNRHYFFILKCCLNPNPARGIYNEFLRGDLHQHRKVFEALAARTKCEPTPDQLSGLGFSTTQRASVVAVVQGKRGSQAYQINF